MTSTAARSRERSSVRRRTSACAFIAPAAASRQRSLRSPPTTTTSPFLLSLVEVPPMPDSEVLSLVRAQDPAHGLAPLDPPRREELRRAILGARLQVDDLVS